MAITAGAAGAAPGRAGGVMRQVVPRVRMRREPEGGRALGWENDTNLYTEEGFQARAR